MTALPVSLSAQLPVFAVLAAAVMHAAWNAMVKVSGDRVAAMARIDFWALLLALAATPFVAFPPAEIWAYLLPSLAVVTLYRVLLIAAYNRGDLSQVYPLMRGSAPAIVALLAAAVAGEQLSVPGYTGVALVSAGILTLVSWSTLDAHQYRVVGLALATGVSIACYTLIDSLGVRAGGDVLMYVVWLEVLEHLPLPLYLLATRRESFRALVLGGWKAGVMGGATMIGAYGLVLWAVSLAAIAQVAALRETSVIIAALIGHFLFREPFGSKRILASILVAGGILLLQSGGTRPG
ncbi:MAG TPA: EamA family transporter [Burkholderiales bacterium]|nr:EamA family transporter [Burkholderiales bacterium]